MVWPLLAAGAVGIAGTAIGEFMGGGTKKEASIQTTTSNTSANNIHQPYENFQPTTNYSPVTSYAYQGAQYIINSPNSTQTPKQAVAQTSNPTVNPSYTNNDPTTAESTTSPTTSSGLGGTDFTMIAIVAGLALVGYGFVTRK